MRNALLLAAIGLGLLGSFSLAQQRGSGRSTYIDSTYGFTFDSPKYPAAQPGQGVTPVILSAPGVDGFASNVNVTIQTVTKTRNEYRELSVQGMSAAGLKINSERDVTVSGRDAIRWDYEGTIQGKTLHFLALAVIDKNRVLLLTCTATPQSFPSLEREFNACLDSFKLQAPSK